MLGSLTGFAPRTCYACPSLRAAYGHRSRMFLDAPFSHAPSTSDIPALPPSFATPTSLPVATTLPRHHNLLLRLIAIGRRWMLGRMWVSLEATAGSRDEVQHRGRVLYLSRGGWWLGRVRCPQLLPRRLVARPQPSTSRCGTAMASGAMAPPCVDCRLRLAGGGPSPRRRSPGRPYASAAASGIPRGCPCRPPPRRLRRQGEHTHAVPAGCRRRMVELDLVVDISSGEGTVASPALSSFSLTPWCTRG
jgi:hypothetical protein